MNSPFLRLGLSDFWKGLLTAVGGAMATALYTILNEGKFPTLDDLKIIGMGALAAGVGYLIRKLFTNTEGKLGPEVGQ